MGGGGAGRGVQVVSLNRRMAKGAAWLVSLRMFNRSVGLVSTLVLARLLVPEDFGLVAMATALLALVTTFSELGVDAVLIQKSSLDRADMDGAWSLRAAIGAGQAALLAALAILVADFYEEPRLEPIMYALAFAAFVTGLKNIGTMEFQREFNFHKEFLLLAGRKLAGFVVTLSLAIAFRAYWALIAGIVAGRLMEVFLSYAMHPYRPRFTLARWGALFRFSKWLLINSGLSFINRRGADLLLGKIAGAHSVGLFSIAYEVAMLPTTELVAPINRAIFAGYSRMRETEGALRKGYLEVAGAIAVIALPAAAGIAVTAELLIPMLLGENWLELVPLLQPLALAGGVAALLSNTTSVFLALGRPHVFVALLAFHILMLVPAMFYAGMQYGALGVAYVYLGVFLVVMPMNLYVVFTALGISLWEYIRVMYRPLAATAVMAATLGLWLVPGLKAAPLFSAMGAAPLAVALGAALYGAVLLLLWQGAGRPDGAESTLLGLLGQRLARSAAMARFRVWRAGRAGQHD